MRNIRRLSEAEKGLAVREIVRKGLVKPRDQFRKLFAIKRICTFRTVLFGAGDCLFLGILAAVCLWFFLTRVDSQVIVCMVFAVSPFAYIVSDLLTTWKEHLLQLYDVKMTCRYTIRQISAFRLLYFSGFNLFLNVLLVALLTRFWFSAVIFWKILGLSFSAVFLYGVILVLFQMKGNPYLTSIFPPVLWGMVNALVIAFYGEEVEKMLLGLAGSLVAMIMLVLLGIYLITLFAFFTSKSKVEDQYVIG
ncbi:MAG: hypothetical protein NC417_04085 [Candidatus Gastranaerophilales bacterium]|nr:hypothetical protein [Candidatus Gastranaerophilales bacterium]